MIYKLFKRKTDNQITSHFQGYAASLTNLPASDWATNAEKDKHIDDLFYNSSTGYSYRFMLDNTAYKWTLVRDEGIYIAKALQDASQAQDKAESKRRVFVSQPTTPYDAGDLWDNAGAVYRSSVTKTTSATFSSADWADGQLVLKENTITKSSIAPAHLNGRLWLALSTTPNVLKRSTGTTWVKVTPTTASEVGSYSTTQVDNALAGKVARATYSTDQQGVVDRFESNETAITQNATDITSRVTKTIYEVDINDPANGLKAKMTSAESSITQNATAITSKVESSTFDSLEGRVDTVASTIAQHSDQIALKVDKNAVVAAINLSIDKIEGAQIDLVGAVNVLSDITGSLGVINAGTINGVTINGSTFKSQLDASNYTLIENNSIYSEGTWTDTETNFGDMHSKFTVSNGKIIMETTMLSDGNKSIIEQSVFGQKVADNLGDSTYISAGGIGFGGWWDNANRSIYTMGSDLVVSSAGLVIVHSKLNVENEGTFAYGGAYVDPEYGVGRALKTSGGIATDYLYVNAGSVGSTALKVNGKVDILGQGLEMRWAGGTPFIDFSNNSTSDYGARLIYNGDLKLSGAAFAIDGNLYSKGVYNTGTSGSANVYVSSTGQLCRF